MQHLSDITGKQVKVAAHYDTNVSVPTFDEIHSDFINSFIEIADIQRDKQESKLRSFFKQRGISSAGAEEYINQVKAHTGKIGQDLIFEDLLPEAEIKLNYLLDRNHQDEKMILLNTSKNIRDWHRVAEGDENAAVNNILLKAKKSISKNELDKKQLIQTLHKGLDDGILFLLRNEDKFLHTPHIAIKEMNNWIRHKSNDEWDKYDYRKNELDENVEHRAILEQKEREKND